ISAQSCGPAGKLGSIAKKPCAPPFSGKRQPTGSVPADEQVPYGGWQGRCSGRSPVRFLRRALRCRIGKGTRKGFAPFTIVMSLRLFLCGDVMLGRGIDQALPHPGNPILYEPYVRDAREYVHLAEKAHGPIPRPLTFDYIWGDALQELERAEVDFRIANLETAIAS